ncbi:MAG TPA: methyltransferase domain-containing protein [Silvibacterium sp.]|nr:methyltransferase domain-containing protein [Silvibacterium sp.]
MTGNIMSTTLPSVYIEPAFDTIAEEYDRLFTYSILGKAQRALIHEELRKRFREGHRILDLNCGTGEDAVLMAAEGVSVLACDVSKHMISVAWQKFASCGVTLPVTFAVCANEQLDSLKSHGQFDGALSNFGGLNCTADLAQVRRALSDLIRPGGEVLLCMLGRFCAWEIFWHATHGRWNKAFRRMKAGGTDARIGGTTIRVYYPSVHKIQTAFAPSFRLASWRGIGVALPPSWMEYAFQERPLFVELLTRIDRWLGAAPLFRGTADHILLRFVRESK